MNAQPHETLPKPIVECIESFVMIFFKWLIKSANKPKMKEPTKKHSKKKLVQKKVKKPTYP